MSKVRSFREFLSLESTVTAKRQAQSQSYLESHSKRLYGTYVVCAKLPDISSKKLISFGAGSAYIEHALAKWHGVSVTIVDFREMVKCLSPFYAEVGFKVVPANIMDESATMEDEYDVALSSEVVEHIPRPPAEHIRLLSSAVKPGGHIIVTTPNFGNIRVICRLLFMRPILPQPEQTFGPVCFENEGVHRREYLPVEIINAFKACDVQWLKTTFSENRVDKRIVLRLAVDAIPRFRATMILHGQKISDT